MQTTQIDYEFDGLHLIGELAVDETIAGQRPAVLVCHDAGGLGEHPRAVAYQLAELGYVAFALDYHGGGVLLPAEEVMPRLGVLGRDTLGIRAIGQAGLDVLLASEFTDPSRVAAIGYCFGGTMVLELARSGAALQAVVGFHSGLATKRPEDAVNITAKVLVCIGADDPIIPPAQRQAFEDEMRTGGADWQLHLYGGVVHSFTNPASDGSANPAIKYDKTADERSWAAMLGLFGEVFSHD